MENTALFALGLICLGLAVVWYFVWPKDKTPAAIKQQPTYRPRSAWLHMVLRWFHLLVWMCLAAACFAAAGQSSLASTAALLAGILYLVFVTALMKDKQRRKANEYEGTGS